MQFQKGMTLIELMIVVAIVGIISAIAYPSYQSMVVSSARSAAQADLMAFASAMERHSASTFSYAGAAAGGSDTGTPTVFVGHSPATEPPANARYNLTISAVGAGGRNYQLTATPITGSAVANDGELHIFSDGRKAWDENGDGNLATSEFCWGC